MSRRSKRLFECGVVNERVSVRLLTRRIGGYTGKDVPFVQCDQLECQYSDVNESPCQLRPELFADET